MKNISRIVEIIVALSLGTAMITSCTSNRKNSRIDVITTESTTEQIEMTTTETTTKPVRIPSDSPPPFGDLHGAYICIYGMVTYPSVYVLTQDEVSELADYFNSEIWEEEYMDDYVSPTGSFGLCYFIYKDGHCSSLSDLGSLYRADGVVRNFIHYPQDDDFSNQLTAYDILDAGDNSRSVKTHIDEQKSEMTDQEYWDLVWNDVLPWIEEHDK